MGDTKWGGLQVIDDKRGAWRRMSMRMRRRFTTGPVRWRRRIASWVVAAVLIVAGILYKQFRPQIQAQLDARQIVVNIDALRRGAKALTTVRGGELTLNPRENLLDEIVRRGYVEENIANAVAAYRVVAVHQVQKTPLYFSVTVQCDSDSLCHDLRGAFATDPGFLAKRSPPANPLALVFLLRAQRSD